jgi:hypothetical protein
MYFEKDEIEKRLMELLEAEARIVKALPITPMLH